ncbi:hypothetical protein CASFOL_018931 [Castilleja foliolosa]|uniref:Uncharacterized protein n=1 Tax=Castilleja foliolosa TaxID=1961234 RepID=A0ABD3D7B2_9LAMI
MDENSGDDESIDWSTDDELEILSGTTTASPPTLVSCTDVGERQAHLQVLGLG